MRAVNNLDNHQPATYHDGLAGPCASKWFRIQRNKELSQRAAIFCQIIHAISASIGYNHSRDIGGKIVFKTSSFPLGLKKHQ